jgi:hypothetical protein
MPIINFWVNIVNKYPLLGEKPIAVLLPLSTMYLCESIFYVCTYENQIQKETNVEPDPTLYLSPVVPDFQALCRSNQAYPSQ